MDLRSHKRKRFQEYAGPSSPPPAAPPNKIQPHGSEIDKLNRQESEHAMLSKAAYDRDYTAASNMGYVVNAEFNTSRDMTVFENPLRGNAVVAFRGSVTKADWGRTDKTLALYGGHLQDDPRFIRHSQILENVLDKYDRSDVQLTGHSLGGTEAVWFGTTYNMHTNAFNPGSAINSSLGRKFTQHAKNAADADGLKTSDVLGNQNVHHISSDPLSMLRGYGNMNKYSYSVKEGLPFVAAHNLGNYAHKYDPAAIADAATPPYQPPEDA